jgi:hypothetical protein
MSESELVKTTTFGGSWSVFRVSRNASKSVRKTALTMLIGGLFTTMRTHAHCFP